MAIDLNKQYGPFSLKIWLVIGVGGIGAGLLLAKHLGQNQTATNDASANGGITAPPGVIFNRVIIGLEHVPGAGDDVKPLNPAVLTPVTSPITPKPTISMGLNPIHQPSQDYTAVNSDVWSKFIGSPVKTVSVGGVGQQSPSIPLQPYTGLDASGNAYF